MFPMTAMELDQVPRSRFRMKPVAVAFMIIGTIVSLVLGSVLVKRAIEDAASPEKANELALLDNRSSSLNKKGIVYGGGNFAPYRYPNITLISATHSATGTAVNVTTHTVDPAFSAADHTIGALPSGSISTVTNTVTVTATPYGPFYGQTATDDGPCVLGTATEDVVTQSVTSISSSVSSSVTTAVNTVSSSTTGYTDTTSDDGSSSTSVSAITELPTITMTITIQAPTFSNEEFTSTETDTVTPFVTTTETTTSTPTSSSEEYTSTETVTVTPFVTTTKTTTSTLAQTTKTSTTGGMVTETDSSESTVTVTVYVLPTLTELHTGTISTVHIATSKTVTATVLQTVVPIPSDASTTTRTESVVTSSDTAVSSASPHVTVITTLLTSTIMGKFGNLTSTMDTVVTYTTTFTMTPSAANTTWTKWPVTANHTAGGTDFGAMTVPITHEPCSSSETVSWSTEPTKSTSSATMQVVTAPSGTDFHVAPTHSPTHSGADSLKPDATVFWGGSNGGGSGSCIVMLVAIVSLIQVFVI